MCCAPPWAGREGEGGWGRGLGGRRLLPVPGVLLENRPGLAMCAIKALSFDI